MVGDSNQSAKTPFTHYDWVDSLRAIAVLLVVMVHTSQSFGCIGLGSIDNALGCGMY